MISFVSVVVKLLNTKDVLIASHVQKLTSCINGIWGLWAAQRHRRFCAEM